MQNGHPYPQLPLNRLQEEWAKYKYVVMEKDYHLYKLCSATLHQERDGMTFYDLIDQALALPFNPKNYINTLFHVWGYFKKRASTEERNHFFALMHQQDFVQGKKYLQTLSIKYNMTYLLRSYYFLF